MVSARNPTVDILATLARLKALLIQEALLSTTAPAAATGEPISLGKAASSPPRDGQAADPTFVRDIGIILEAVYKSALARKRGGQEDLETIAKRIRVYPSEWPAEAVALVEGVPVKDVARIRANMRGQK